MKKNKMEKKQQTYPAEAVNSVVRTRKTKLIQRSFRRFRSFSRLLSVLMVAGTACGLYIAHRKNRSEELEAQNDISGEKYYDTLFCSRKLKLSGSGVPKLTLKAMMGAVSLELRDLKPGDELILEIDCVMSGILLEVSGTARICTEEQLRMSGFVNQVEEPDEPDAPVIYLQIKSLCSGIGIRPVSPKTPEEGRKKGESDHDC